jgi:hypothetical protein
MLFIERQSRSRCNAENKIDFKYSSYVHIMGPMCFDLRIEILGGLCNQTKDEGRQIRLYGLEQSNIRPEEIPANKRDTISQMSKGAQENKLVVVSSLRIHM